MSVNNVVEQSIWWLLEKLQQDRLTYVSDIFIFDVTEPEDSYSATQQRKLLARFKADGLLNYSPHRGQIEALRVSVYEPQKYYDADSFKVTLNVKAFDNAYEQYRLKYGQVQVRLIKDHVELFVEVDNKKFPLHTFTPASIPDILFDYLLYKQPDEEITKKKLVDEGLLDESSQSLNVFMHKAGLKGRLAKYFLPTNEKSKIRLRPQLTLSAEEATKLEDDLL
jgi:hypothetical protein